MLINAPGGQDSIAILKTAATFGNLDLIRCRDEPLDRWDIEVFDICGDAGKVVRTGLAGRLTQRHGDGPHEGLGVDRGVDRRPEKPQCYVCIRGIDTRRLCRSSAPCNRACFS